MLELAVLRWGQWISIAGTLVALDSLRWIHYNAVDTDAVRDWIRQDSGESFRGEMRVGGQPIDLEDEIFPLPVYIGNPIPLVIAVAQTRYFVRGREPIGGMWIEANLINLFMGWWNLPVGFLVSLIVLGMNMFGGERCQIGQLAVGGLVDRVEANEDEPMIRKARLCRICIGLSVLLRVHPGLDGVGVSQLTVLPVRLASSNKITGELGFQIPEAVRPSEEPENEPADVSQTPDPE